MGVNAAEGLSTFLDVRCTASEHTPHLPANNKFTRLCQVHLPPSPQAFRTLKSPTAILAPICNLRYHQIPRRLDSDSMLYTKFTLVSPVDPTMRNFPTSNHHFGHRRISVWFR